MIISQDIIPEKNLYYVGAKILDMLCTDKNTTIVGLFDKYNNSISDKSKQIDMTSLILAIDWLYILGLIDYNDGYSIKLSE